ncbi:MAG: hypothetical protein KC684_05195 [Candidatus Omnitrophica bacterium]|nr:hypothetical protein [Candidatus Omnitrophota bacterium]
MFLKNKKAQSTLEYILVLTFIITAFMVFQKYMLRSIAGRWKTTGDSMGYERQYDPNKTLECAFFYNFDINQWYDYKQCDQTCLESACLLSSATRATCQACIDSCANPLCEDN